MGNAFECDVCGKLYKHYPVTAKVTDQPKYHAITLHIKRGKEKLDACPRCRAVAAEKLIEYYRRVEGCQQ